MIIFHIKMLIKTIDPRERNLMIYRRDSPGYIKLEKEKQ